MEIKLTQAEPQDNNDKTDLVGLFGCGGTLCLVIALFCLWNLVKIPEALSSKSWDQVKAKVEKVYYDSSGGTSSGNGTSSSNVKYYPMMNYSYEYKDVSYKGSRVLVTGRRGPKMGTSNQALLFLSTKQDKDGNIPIYVNPDNPTKSVVITGISSGMIKGVCWGTVFFVGATILFLVYLIKRKPRAEEIEQNNSGQPD